MNEQLSSDGGSKQSAPHVKLSAWLGCADALPASGKFIYTKENIHELAKSQTPWELRIDYELSINGTTDPKTAVRITSASFIQKWNVVKTAFPKAA